MHAIALVSLVVMASPLEQSLATYSKAYNTVFDRMKSVELSDAQTRITRLGAAGKAFQPELEALRKRQGEVSDLMVKAVLAKKKAEADRSAAAVDVATNVLVDADARMQTLVTDVKRFGDKLTAAGAPIIETPPRDPNARD